MLFRSIVTNALKSSDVLIGSNIFYKYKLSLLSKNNSDKYELCIGQPIVATVPVEVMIQRVHSCAHKTESEFLVDESERLEKMLDPGIPIFDNTTQNTEEELQFIKDSKDIPEKYKKDLLKHLRTIPELYSGSVYGSKSFPPEIYTHDVEFLDEQKTKQLPARPFPCSGIRLEQLKFAIGKLEKEEIGRAHV